MWLRKIEFRDASRPLRRAVARLDGSRRGPARRAVASCWGRRKRVREREETGREIPSSFFRRGRPRRPEPDPGPRPPSWRGTGPGSGPRRLAPGPTSPCRPPPRGRPAALPASRGRPESLRPAPSLHGRWHASRPTEGPLQARAAPT